MRLEKSLITGLVVNVIARKKRNKEKNNNKNNSNSNKLNLDGQVKT